MKKRIAGKLYDTATAKEIARVHENGRSVDAYTETLYRKRTGEYFLHGDGGPASPWCVACPTGGYDSGSDIRPLTAKEAEAWAHRRLSQSEAEELFPPKTVPTRTGETVDKMLSLDSGVLGAAQRAADMSGQALSRWVEETIETVLS